MFYNKGKTKGAASLAILYTCWPASQMPLADCANPIPVFTPDATLPPRLLQNPPRFACAASCTFIAILYITYCYYICAEYIYKTMSKALPVKKIYIDSKFKTLDSFSNTNFKYQLPRNVTLPSNCTFYIDDVSIPHSWWTIEAGVNDRLFVQWYALGPPVPGFFSSSVDTALQIPAGNYNGTTLASTLQDLLLNTLLWLEPQITCRYSVTQNNISIKTNSFGAFFFPTDFIIRTSDQWIAFREFAAASCNDVIGNTEAPIPAAISQVTNNLNLTNFRNIFISSTTLGCFNSIGPNGESNIIKKVPVNADWGSTIVDVFTTENDFISCDKQTLNLLEFTIHDEKGNFLPLHGGHVSFSIVFNAHNEDVL